MKRSAMRHQQAAKVIKLEKQEAASTSMDQNMVAKNGKSNMSFQPRISS